MSTRQIKTLSTCLLLSCATTTLVNANSIKAVDTDNTLNKTVIEQSLGNFSSQSLSGQPQRIQRFNAFYNAAANKEYVQTLTSGIALGSLLYNEYPAYANDPLVKKAEDQTKQAGIEVYKAAKNIRDLTIMDQHLVAYKHAFDNAWQARVDFWQDKDNGENAQDFNHFLNYMLINGISLVQKQGTSKAMNTYVQINGLAYQLQVDVQGVYKKARDGAIKNLYSVTPEVLKSNVMALRQNATISGVTQAVVDVNHALEAALNINKPVKVFGVTIFTLKLPQSVKDFVHKAENKTGLTDSYQALMFMMKSDINQIADYQAMQKAAKSNDFAKLLVSLTQALAPKLGVKQDQMYWALMNQIAIYFSKSIQ
ncbi:hypothetical protein [Facilibium subflavum]|uniref:hypothetical protein n=1 Tax=Facilibium subflavum TaxID=2219058 RepID=UPI000E652EB4|nr:hypothetical protein [Facilibium subflavum]